jgi:hypothetical protein
MGAGGDNLAAREAPGPGGGLEPRQAAGGGDQDRVGSDIRLDADVEDYRRIGSAEPRP